MKKKEIRPFLEQELADWIEKWFIGKQNGGDDLTDAKVLSYPNYLSMAKAALKVIYLK